MAKTRFQWEADSGEPRDAVQEGRGRSQRKREAKATEALVDDLLRLSVREVAELPLAADTIDALETLRTLSERRGVRGALRRQRLQVAGRLRREDLDALRAALPEHPGVSEQEITLRLAERWRARLLQEGDPAIAALLTEHPGGDRQRLRQLVRQARKDAAGPEERKSKAFRELFAAVRAVLG